MIKKPVFSINCPNSPVSIEECLDNFEEFTNCGISFIENKIEGLLEDGDDLLCYLVVKDAPPMKSYLRPYAYEKFLNNALDYYISNEMYEGAPRVKKLLDIIKNKSYATKRIND